MRLRIWKKLEDGRLEATASDMPTFLYEDGNHKKLANPPPGVLRYDPKDIEIGIVRGYYHVRVQSQFTIFHLF